MRETYLEGPDGRTLTADGGGVRFLSSTCRGGHVVRGRFATRFCCKVRWLVSFTFPRAVGVPAKKRVGDHPIYWSLNGRLPHPRYNSFE